MVILKKRLPGIRKPALEGFLRRALTMAGEKTSVSVLVTGSPELRALNRRFRGKDRATDVLSFPSLTPARQDFLGDIAIAADIATRNSQSMGHSPAEELKILILHGVLHLAGYDHERDNGSMARKEAQMRKALGLPVGLLERSRMFEAGPRSAFPDQDHAARPGKKRATRSARARRQP